MRLNPFTAADMALATPIITRVVAMPASVSIDSIIVLFQFNIYILVLTFPPFIFNLYLQLGMLVSSRCVLRSRVGLAA